MFWALLNLFEFEFFFIWRAFCCSSFFTTSIFRDIFFILFFYLLIDFYFFLITFEIWKVFADFLEIWKWFPYDVHFFGGCCFKKELNVCSLGTARLFYYWILISLFLNDLQLRFLIDKFIIRVAILIIIFLLKINHLTRFLGPITPLLPIVGIHSYCTRLCLEDRIILNFLRTKNINKGRRISFIRKTFRSKIKWIMIGLLRFLLKLICWWFVSFIGFTRVSPLSSYSCITVIGLSFCWSRCHLFIRYIIICSLHISIKTFLPIFKIFSLLVLNLLLSFFLLILLFKHLQVLLVWHILTDIFWFRIATLPVLLNQSINLRYTYIIWHLYIGLFFSLPL